MVAKKSNSRPNVLAEGKRLYEQTLAPVDDISRDDGYLPAARYTTGSRKNWRLAPAAAPRPIDLAQCARAAPRRRLLPGPMRPAARRSPAARASRSAARRAAERIQAVAEQRDGGHRAHCQRVIAPGRPDAKPNTARARWPACRAALREITALNRARPTEESRPMTPNDDDAFPATSTNSVDELARRITRDYRRSNEAADRTRC